MIRIHDVFLVSKNYKKMECLKEPFDVLRCPFLVDTKLPHLLQSQKKEKTGLAKQTKDNFKGAWPPPAIEM